MIGDVLRSNLLLDLSTNNRTATAVQTANPGMFASASNVPAHLTTSLQTLLSCATATDLGKRIVSVYGEGNTTPDASIEIRVLPQDAARYSRVMQVDTIGAESAVIHILFRQPAPVQSPNYQLIENLELRTRWLLDYFVRGRRGVATSLDVSADPSVIQPSNTAGLSNYCVCIWQRPLRGEDAAEMVDEYTAEYVRAFGI